MINYIINSDFDFYSELNKLIQEPEKEETNDNVCLITNMPLTDNHIQLRCKHKFNYVPLVNDLKNHKKKFNNMEVYKLKTNEIRCPYCRSKQKELLPYYENMGVEKYHGINYIDELLEMKTIMNNCNHNHKNGECDYNNILLYPNEQPLICQSHYVYNCPYDGKKYCYSHNKIMIKHFYNQKKLADKQAKEDAKMVANQKKENAKMVAKQKKEDAKQAKKNDKNIVITPNENIIITNGMCHAILKTGSNKGNQCCVKTYLNQLCVRHYNISIKNGLNI